MKTVLIFLSLFAFLFYGFRPPDGVRKLPAANIQFEMETASGVMRANFDTQQEK